MSHSVVTVEGQPAPRWARLATAVLVVVGTLIATYMTYEHFTGNESLMCSATGVIDCASVTTSTYSMFLGVPVALAGLLWFVATVAVAWWGHTRAAAPLRRKVLLAWYGVGLLFVLYLVWVELVPLGKICSWCTVVHIITLALFLVALADYVLESD
ncbi:hypothetical protein GCM10027030_01020 [Luteococcus sediminum]